MVTSVWSLWKGHKGEARQAVTRKCNGCSREQDELGTKTAAASHSISAERGQLVITNQTSKYVMRA